MFLSARTPFIGACLVLSTLVVGGCATEMVTTAPITNTSSPMMLTLGQDHELSTFTKLVQSAGLMGTISEGTNTVFAPTDEAFKTVPSSTLDKLNKDPELLKSVLSYHILTKKVSSSSIESSLATETLNGAKLGLSRAGDFVTVDDALVTTADIQAGNGVIHKIDRVLMPAVKK